MLRVRCSSRSLTTVILAFTWAGAQAQEPMAPWIGGLPGTEHPAAWALGDTPWAMGLQHATKWSGAEAMQDQWLGIGWKPESNSTGWSNTGLSGWAFGLSSSTLAAANGWQEMRHALHCALRVPLDQGWTGSAGIGIGVHGWVLDGTGWSWDAQYGPGGYDPQSATGEPDGTVAGAGLSPEVALGVAAERQQRPGQGPSIKGALSLHHVLNVEAPNFSSVHADTVRRTVSWWVEAQDILGKQRLAWRGWSRGARQGPSFLLEFGAGIGKSFGSPSRFTRNERGHVLEIGATWRSDGIIRIPLTWQHGEVKTWIAPGVNAGHPSPAAQGWAIGMGWTPDFSGTTQVGSR
jgi:hypothetical protein